MNFRMIAAMLGGLASGRQTRKMMWASLIGLGVSATAMGLRRTRYRNILPKIQHAADRFLPGQARGNTAMAEFSSEFLPKQPAANRQNQPFQQKKQ